MKRVMMEELLDTDSGTAEEVAASLESIREVNRRFGGNQVHAEMLSRVASRMGSRKMHVLEVASGHADVLQAAARRLMERGVELRITLLDLSAGHFPGEGDWDGSLAAPEKVEGDALRIPLADASVDVVSCCLFLHHLDEAEAAHFLQEALRVARVAVVVNDLERTQAHYLLARMRALVDSSRLSRHDGPVSVGRSYTRAELRGLLARTGFGFELRRRFLYRMGAVVWVG